MNTRAVKPSLAVAAGNLPVPDLVSLARRLNLPLCDDAALAYANYDFVLRHGHADDMPILQIQANGPDAPGPLYVDFVGGALGYRKRHSGHAREPLARAVGIKSRLLAPSVVDATGGLGRDAFVLACLGCHLTVLERAPLMAALLRDGLARAEADAATAQIASRMQLVEGDAAAYLTALVEGENPDVVYLDPMYPERGKSALVKKEMRYLRSLVGDDLDAPALLTAALHAARRRVVVKRPRLAQPLAGPPPSSTLMGNTTRFDIYLRPATMPPQNAKIKTSRQDK